MAQMLTDQQIGILGTVVQQHIENHTDLSEVKLIDWRKLINGY